MKLGISYNVFEDSIELLPFSIRAMRPHVDFISIVYQKVSNTGIPASSGFEERVRVIAKECSVDALFTYVPNRYSSATSNERTKRNIGLRLSRRARCSHHMAMDSDEFFRGEHIGNMREDIKKNNHDAQFAQMKTFYKYPTSELVPPEEYYVPLFYKVRLFSRYSSVSNLPVKIDPTRAQRILTCTIFTRDEVEMYHMCYVRRDLRSKLLSSSAGELFKDRVNDIVAAYDAWQPGMKAVIAGVTDVSYDTKESPNLFSIPNVYEKEKN